MVQLVTPLDADARKAWDKLSRQARCMHLAPLALAIISKEGIGGNIRRDVARQMVVASLSGALPSWDDFQDMIGKAHKGLDWLPGVTIMDYLDAMSGRAAVYKEEEDGRDSGGTEGNS